MSAHLVKVNMLAPCANPPSLSVVSNGIKFEPHQLIVLHPRGCPCSTVIEGDFVSKGVEQFDHSSKEKDLEYDKYSMLLIQE
jgi:hypothetical protein